MLPRQAAFHCLRRITLRDFRPSNSVVVWPRSISRPIHFCATPNLRKTSSPFIIPRKTQEPPSEKSLYERPSYEMTFTCKPCSTRSTHRITKQGYHYGSVLISCPGCKNRHVISDHLNIFGDTSMTVEDLVKEKGRLVKKGKLSEDGAFEIWSDGTTTSRTKSIGGDESAGTEQKPVGENW